MAQTDGAMDDRAADRAVLLASKAWSKPKHGGPLPRSSRQLRPFAAWLDGPATPFPSVHSSESACDPPTSTPHDPLAAAPQPVQPRPTTIAPQTHTDTPSSPSPAQRKSLTPISRADKPSNALSNSTPPKPTPSNPQTPTRSRHPSDSPSPTVPSTPLPKQPQPKTCVCVLLGQPPCDNHIVRTTYCDCSGSETHTSAATEARGRLLSGLGDERSASVKSVRSKRGGTAGRTKSKEEVQWEGVQGALEDEDGDECARGIGGVRGVVRRMGCGVRE